MSKQTSYLLLGLVLLLLLGSLYFVSTNIYKSPTVKSPLVQPSPAINEQTPTVATLKLVADLQNPNTAMLLLNTDTAVNAYQAVIKYDPKTVTVKTVIASPNFPSKITHDINQTDGMISLAYSIGLKSQPLTGTFELVKISYTASSQLTAEKLFSIDKSQTTISADGQPLFYYTD